MSYQDKLLCLQVADKFSLALSTTLHRNNEDFPDYYDKVSWCMLQYSTGHHSRLPVGVLQAPDIEACNRVS